SIKTVRKSTPLLSAIQILLTQVKPI
ncbi:Phage capsid scaffolding protein (GPO) serine peptidase, partial [Haemophilus influenzae]